MPVDIQQRGQYELFETTKEHRILVLDDKQWYAAVEGQQGDILVQSDSDHKRRRTLQKGRFYIVDFNDDPKFKDMHHLFLEKDGAYQEVMIPNGLPSGSDYQKKVVWTDNSIKHDELEAYLQNPAPAGPGEEGMGRPGGGSMANVAHYLKGIDLPASKEQVIRYAKRNDAPKAVIHQLDKLQGERFRTMADITQGMSGLTQGERLPVDNYENLSAEEAAESVKGLDRDGLEQIRRFEQANRNRKTVLQAIDAQEAAQDDLPIDNYNELTADEVAGKLDNLSKDERKRVRKFEKQHKGRKTVLEAIERS